MEQKILNIALPIIKAYEGCQLKAYLCPAGIWTIGWGQTGKEIKEGVFWTQKQADAALKASVSVFIREVLKLIKVRARPEQIAALVSFAYNLGTPSLAKSTLLRLFNENKNVEEISSQFLLWSKANNKRLLGLLLRRASEAMVFSGKPFIRFNSIEEASRYISIPAELHPTKTSKTEENKIKKSPSKPRVSKK